MAFLRVRRRRESRRRMPEQLYLLRSAPHRRYPLQVGSAGAPQVLAGGAPQEGGAGAPQVLGAAGAPQTGSGAAPQPQGCSQGEKHLPSGPLSLLNPSQTPAQGRTLLKMRRAAPVGEAGSTHRSRPRRRCRRTCPCSQPSSWRSTGHRTPCRCPCRRTRLRIRRTPSSVGARGDMRTLRPATSAAARGAPQSSGTMDPPQ